ncbi:hypothetical protein [Aneurinibacillus tyrosinisolvens]|uniref:hypothetical protein n=1 Tax=Aneurinibacillus tyrosinisolvens TaxID=1443435 RepID=UPI00063F9509|nr:hypothetical protein [Aneurinibacillus tyrosinisolvens]
MNRIIIGMEPTRHYWFNLANWLLDKGINVVLVIINSQKGIRAVYSRERVGKQMNTANAWAMVIVCWVAAYAFIRAGIRFTEYKHKENEVYRCWTWDG